MREGLVKPFSSPTTDTCRQEFGSSLYCPACVRFLIIDELIMMMMTTTMIMVIMLAWMRQEKLGDLAGLSRRGREETGVEEEQVSWQTT